MSEIRSKRHELICSYSVFSVLSRSLLLGTVAFFPASISLAVVPSPILPDGLGPIVNKSGAFYDMNAGTTRSSNLFHSFGQFSVGSGVTTSFHGPNGIVNVLSRLIGGLQSQIDGTLRCTIPRANLHVMNPAAVLFGPVVWPATALLTGLTIDLVQGCGS